LMRCRVRDVRMDGVVACPGHDVSAHFKPRPRRAWFSKCQVCARKKNPADWTFDLPEYRLQLGSFGRPALDVVVGDAKNMCRT
jgi:hypothetical protein